MLSTQALSLVCRVVLRWNWKGGEGEGGEELGLAPRSTGAEMDEPEAAEADGGRGREGFECPGWRVLSSSAADGLAACLLLWMPRCPEPNSTLISRAQRSKVVRHGAALRESDEG